MMPELAMSAEAQSVLAPDVHLLSLELQGTQKPAPLVEEHTALLGQSALLLEPLQAVSAQLVPSSQFCPIAQVARTSEASQVAQTNEQTPVELSHEEDVSVPG